MTKVCYIFGIVLLCGCLNLQGAQTAEPRLRADLNDTETFILSGNTRPAVERGIAIDIGPASRSKSLPSLSIHFTMTPEQRAALDELLKAQQDPNSSKFRHFLTPEEFGDRFGMNSSDLAKITQWLENSGFTNLQVARSRTWISFSGNVGQAETAFHTSLHRYSLHGVEHLANSGDPALPNALSGIVESIRGLNDFGMHPHLLRQHPNFTNTSNGNHYLAPDDWATIYDVQPLYGAGFDGTGISIAVVGQSDVHLSDLRAFRSAASLSAKDPSIVYASADPGYASSGDEVESDLDLEWSGAIARNANILFVVAASVDQSITYAIDHNIAPILSTSYGACEADQGAATINSFESLFAQAVSQGMTILAAAGDDGATDCDDSSGETAAQKGLAVDYPASSQYVTAVGGTRFNDTAANWNTTNNSYGGSATAYMPEITWNDGFQSATGGGVSAFITKPSWQTGTGVPADGMRDVPDIAFAASPAHDGLLICSQGYCSNGFRNSSNNLDIIGGTSAGPPSFAGALALLIQKQGTSIRLGNLNPNLYSLAQTSPSVFHDITNGNNRESCQLGTTGCPVGGLIGYVAAAGYDQTTGWGSIDVNNLAQQWFSNFQISASPTALSVVAGNSATSTVTVAPQGYFSGNVTISCSVASALTYVTCSPSSTTVNGSGSVTITVAASNLARTPLWRRFPWRPLGGRFAMASLFALLIVAVMFAPRKKIWLLPAFSSALLLVICETGCGGAGSSGSSGGGGTTTPATLKITCALPGATVGQSYSGSCSSSGGTGAVSYSVVSGALPAGLTLNASTGVVSGTPTIAGTSSPTIQVADSGSPQQTASEANTIVVSVTPAALKITCTLPGATVGQSYSGSCSASGGTGTVSYSVISGALPAGLTLNASTGAVSGAPTTAGTNSLTMQVADSGSPQQTATQAVAIVVSVTPAVLRMTCTLPGATVGQSYSGSCSASGGTGTLSYSVVSGALPAGLTLNASTGAVSGTPTTAGTSSLTMQAADSGSPQQTATQAVTIVVSATAVPLRISCTMPNATVGQSYSGACSSSGGTGTLSYSVVSGALPAGVTLNASTGVVSGTPTAAGTSSPTIQVADSGSPQQTATQANTIVVSAAPLSLSCTAPATVVQGASYTGQCSTSGGTTPIHFAVTSGALPTGLNLNSSTGAITGAPATAGTFSNITITATDSGSPVQTVTFTITQIHVTYSHPLSLSCQFPVARVGVAYSSSCTPSGGSATYTYSLVSGTLPNGLSFNSASGAVTGVPSAPNQTAALSISVTDSSLPPQTATAGGTISVAPASVETGLVTVTATSGGITNTVTISVTVTPAP